MNTYPDLVGQKFGWYTVLSYAGRDKYRNSKWLCRCACGAERVVYALALKSGDTKSCGCYHKSIAPFMNRTHGESRDSANVKRTTEYVIWVGMRQRCYNPKNPRYKYYGGFGIKVCDRWKNSFENFLADVGRRPAGKSIDRINRDGDYEPGNVRWATPREQALNRHPKYSMS